MSYTNTTAILAAGTTLGYSTTVGGTYTNFAEPTKVSLPKVAVGKVKATNMNSLNKTHEYIAGFSDPGEVDFETNYTRADWIYMNANKGVQQFFKITLPDGTTAGTTGVFPGFISGVEGDAPAADEKLIGKMKLTLTAGTTWTAGT